MKIWFFVEGKSEEHFILSFMRRYHPTVLFSKDLSEFIKSTDSLFYLKCCNDGSKIPHDINEDNHYIQRSNVNLIIVVTDTDRGICPKSRREKILSLISEEVNQQRLFFIFSIPTIEEIYCYERDIALDVITYFFKKAGKPISTNTSLNKSSQSSPLESIKSIFRQAGMTYKKVEFAEKFFGKLDYEKSTNKTVTRLWDKLNTENEF